MLSVRVFGLEFYERTLCVSVNAIVSVCLYSSFWSSFTEEWNSNELIAISKFPKFAFNWLHKTYKYVQNGMFTRRVNIPESVYILMK